MLFSSKPVGDWSKVKGIEDKLYVLYGIRNVMQGGIVLVLFFSHFADYLCFRKPGHPQLLLSLHVPFLQV